MSSMIESMPVAFSDSIRLGLMSPLTGLVSIYGSEILWAARIAVEEINEAGGVLGRPLELIVEDDGSLPDTAVPAARRLVEQRGCSAIIGNLLSNSRIAVAAQVAEPRCVPYLNFSFYEGSIFNRYFFNFAALPNQQIERMIPYMAKRYGLKMYFAGNNYEWPRGSVDAAKRALAKINGEVVGEQYLPIGATEAEIDWLLEGVERSGADVFVPYFAGVDQITLLNRFTERGLKQRMAVVMGHYDELMVSHLSPDVRDGFYSSNTYFMSVQTEENRAYLARLAGLPEVDGIWPRGNGVLTNFGEGTYLCVKAFAEAARTAGSVEAEALVHALERVQLRGPQGEVAMDPRLHHARVNSYLARCNADGTFTLIERFGAIAPEIPERYREQFSPRDSNEAMSANASPESAARVARQAEESLRRLGEVHKILSVADMGVIATDEDGTIIEMNASAADLFGYQEGEMIGMSVHLLLPPHLRARHAELLRAFARGADTERRMGQRGEITGYRKDGTFIPLQASIAKFRHHGGWGLVATMQDKSDVKRAEEELTWRATHDPLTGLPNRALVNERLTHALDRSTRSEGSVALLFVDLDGFKEVNDTYGHEAGDVLLRDFSARLVKTVRPGDTVGRLAGDEFVVLCEDVDRPSAVSSLAERIGEEARRAVAFGGTSLSVSASIGIAVGHGATHGAEDLLRYADTAMYAVKQHGRDGWRFFSESLQQEATRRLEISAGLRTALERDEFYVLYQPIVNAENGRIQGAELLLRWRSPNGEVSPGHFIPVAEMTNAIVPIGCWVFEQACRMECRLHDRFGEDAPYVSVNVSARQLSDDDLVSSFGAILEKTGARAERMVLEITETALMADTTAAQQVLERFCALGMRLAVDDFGTGYSSLAQLLRLKAHTIKVDRVFIDGIDHSAENQAVVRAVSRMGKALGMGLVAEGVETGAQRDMVRACGVQCIQGYLFHRPMPPEALLTLIEQEREAGAQTVDPLFFLIYVSRPAADLDTEHYRQILDEALSFNRRNAITGYLVLMEDVFIQYLEGTESVVRRLFERIEKDPRHLEAMPLVEGTIDERLFLDWTMGFSRLDSSRLKMACRSESGRSAFDWYRDNPSACCALFEAISSYL